MTATQALPCSKIAEQLSHLSPTLCFFYLTLSVGRGCYDSSPMRSSFLTIRLCSPGVGFHRRNYTVNFKMEEEFFSEGEVLPVLQVRAPTWIF